MTDWPVKTLGELCLPIERHDPANSGKTEFTYVDLSAVDQVSKRIVGARTLLVEEAPGRARQLLKSGDVLVSTVRPNLNAVALIEDIHDGATASTGFCVLRPNKAFVEPGTIFAWVKNQIFIDELISRARGTSYPAVTDNVVKALEIPVPPLEEQKRIVVLLDAATARITELTACYEQARTHADNLFTSALRDALEGNPDWPVMSLGEVSSIKGGKRLPKGTPWSPTVTSHPYIRATDIRDGIIRTDELVYVPEEVWPKISRYTVEEGDVLITIAGTIGSVSEVPSSLSKANLTENAAKVTGLQGINPSYLSYFLRSSDVKKQFDNLATTTTQAKLALFRIETIEVSVPPLEEQKRIVERLDSMRAKTSEMIATYDAKLTAAKNFRQSILESAFAGEL